MPISKLSPHIRPTLLLAYPVVLSQLGHVLVNVVDSIVVGHTGTVPLAAVSLAVSVSTVLLVMGLGISMGLTPLVATANGRGDVPRLGQLLVNGVALCTVAGLALAALGWLLPPLLPHLNQPPAVVALAGPWVRVLFLSFIPLMVFQGFRQFAEGLGLTRQAMQLSVFANVMNALLCIALVFGKWGAPDMGMMGAAWATLTARVLMALLMGLYVWRSARLRPYLAAAEWRLEWKIQRQLLAIGLPIGVQMTFEVGAFSVSAIMAGWLGARVQAAHQIAINVASVTYMAATGIAAAATIRVGNLLGMGDAQGARRAGFTAYALTFIFMSAMGLLLVIFRQFIPPMYDPNPAVAPLAATLLLIAAGFQISDGIQVVGLGALRGLHDVKIPSVVALLAYWAVALPLSYWMGFGLGWGAPGVWLGLLVGLTLVAVVLLYRFERHSRPGAAPVTAPVNETGVLAR